MNKPFIPFKKKIIPLAFMLIFSGCGFHLRQSESLNNAWTHLAIVLKTNHPSLYQELNKQLKSNQDDSKKIAAKKTYKLIIETEDWQKSIISISSSTTPRQYQLKYHLQFSVQNPEHEYLLQDKSLNIYRQLTLNNDQLLGSELEESTLKQQMIADAVIQIRYQMNQLL